MIMMFYKRMREIDVPELMAGIIAETPDKPWEWSISRDDAASWPM